MSTIPIAEARNLALLFHLNSEPWMNRQAYDQPAELSVFKTSGRPGIPLPSSPSTPLADLIRTRASCRNFTDKPLSLAMLASLLHNTYGVVGLRSGIGAKMHHRPVPSAGALYPLELYVLARSVDGLAPGLYHYAAWHHTLEASDLTLTIETVIPEMQQQFYLAQGAAIVFFTAVFARTMKKYGPRGYRYILFEAGHAAQNLCLLAAEQSLTTLCIGGFRDSAINARLRLNPATEGAVYAVALGEQ
jgi:SagB-type dehydrogenase family enzyme